MSNQLAGPFTRIVMSGIFLVWSFEEPVYENDSIDSAEDLVALISVVKATIKEMPSVSANVRRSVRRLIEACVLVEGRNFEHFL